MRKKNHSNKIYRNTFLHAALYAVLYIKQCKTLSGKFVLIFVRPWYKFENGYTDKCDRFHTV